eukprot:292370-Hanusia_phi.AAC.3
MSRKAILPSWPRCKPPPPPPSCRLLLLHRTLPPHPPRSALILTQFLRPSLSSTLRRFLASPNKQGNAEMVESLLDGYSMAFEMMLLHLRNLDHD